VDDIIAPPMPSEEVPASTDTTALTGGEDDGTNKTPIK
jgi:hypothetical protein